MEVVDAAQTAQVMLRLEPVILEHQLDLVLVYGDVNSTIAAAMVCSKLLVPVAHVEAGLRSFDRTMPEEVNRLLTDQLADMLFTHSADADENLTREGISAQKVHCVGNVMIDTLVRLLPDAQARWDALQETLGLDRYALATLHRPSNVDNPEMLAKVVTTLAKLSEDIPIVCPVHPRTRSRISERGLDVQNGRFRLIEPLGYLEFLALESHAAVVITDSGGVQEETTYLGVPCLTVRESTERPVTVSMGTNVMVGQDMELLTHEAYAVLNGAGKKGAVPPLWDGHASERIADIVAGRR